MSVTVIITVINAVRETPLLDTAYIVLPAAGSSILALIVVSLLTAPDPREKWEKFYRKDADLGEAIWEYR